MSIDESLRNDLLLKELGTRIAALRLKAGRTQEAFALGAGLSRSALQRLEHGDEGARFVTFLAAIRALGRLSAMEVVLPGEERSPIELVKGENHQTPKRARKRQARHSAWKWGDEK